MTQTPPAHPLEPVQAVAPAVADAFKALRENINKAGPLDFTTSELILIAAFATQGLESALKIHSRRLLDAGTDKQAIAHAILLTFGATNTLVEVSRALQWLEEAAS